MQLRDADECYGQNNTVYLSTVLICLKIANVLLLAKVQVPIRVVFFYSERPVTEEEGSKFAEATGALRYVECSALTQKNLKSVFDTAILDALDFQDNCLRKRKRSWKKKRSLSRETPGFKVKQKPTPWWKQLLCVS